MLMGKVPSLSSFRAMSMGEVSRGDTSMRIGAPIAICRDLAPTTLAFSKRVNFLGPIWNLDFLVLA